MKIALVILHADPGRGGAERYTLDLAAGLTAAGHGVTVLASTFAQGLAVRQVQLGGRAMTRVGRYTRFLDTLDEHLASQHYDIVHAMLPVRRCDVYHPHAGMAADVDVGPWPAAFDRRKCFAEVERRLLLGSRPPIVLCLSGYVKRAVRRHYTISDDRLVSLFNGVDLQRFDPGLRNRGEMRDRLGVADEQVLALMIAQDFERKGLRQTIEAMGLVRDERLVLMVVGGDASPPYRRLASRLGVGERVWFVGVTSDPRPYYAAADFFVLPTRHDPCSLVVLEALAMGLPVISTVQNGACEVMTDGQEGFVLEDSADVRGLAQAMRSMMGPGVRQRMREACLALRPRLSYEAHLGQLVDAYGTAISAGGH